MHLIKTYISEGFSKNNKWIYKVRAQENATGSEGENVSMYLCKRVRFN